MSFVIAGGSYSAINAVKLIAKKIIPAAVKRNPFFQATVTVIAPNTEAYWNIAAPRLIVEPEFLDEKTEQLFFNLEESLRQYIPLTSRHTLNTILGKVISVNSSSNTVTYMKLSTQVEESAFAAHVIDYNVLVLATGTSSSSAAFKLNGCEEQTKYEIRELSTQVEKARSVCIVGAGAVGVELAGEIGYKYGKTKNITLYSGVQGTFEYGTTRTSNTAVSKLKALGVETVLDVRAISARKEYVEILEYQSSKSEMLRSSSCQILDHMKYQDHVKQKDVDSWTSKSSTKDSRSVYSSSPIPHPLSTFASQDTSSDQTMFSIEKHHRVQVLPEVKKRLTTRTLVTFDNGYQETFDCCIFTTGNIPNSSYLPIDTLNEQGYVLHDSHLRMLHNNPNGNIYVFGDLAAGGKQTLLDVINIQYPVLKATLMHDIISRFRYSLKEYKQGASTYLVPISQNGGVGVVYGITVPSLVVSVLKGKKYLMNKSNQYLV